MSSLIQYVIHILTFHCCGGKPEYIPPLMIIYMTLIHVNTKALIKKKKKNPQNFSHFENFCSIATTYLTILWMAQENISSYTILRYLAKVRFGLISPVFLYASC